uniref:Uncharacterized protein n=1 Tax=Solanum tuberosum TaxID=4113 RepID=M1DJT0_SOLTU
MQIGEPKTKSATHRKGQKSSNGQIWQNQEKSEYPGDMDVMGLSLIVRVHALILFSEAAGLNLEVGVESRHVRPFGELGRACRTTRRSAEVPLIAFNFLLNCELGFITFGKKPEFAKVFLHLPFLRP